jgi:hypothetical protein
VSCCLECTKFIPYIRIKSNETEWKGERIADVGYFIMLCSRSMVTYTSDTGLIVMANQSTQRWVNTSRQPLSTSVPVQGRWRAIQVCWTHGRWMSKRQLWPTCIKSGDLIKTDGTTGHTTQMNQWFPSLSLLSWVYSQSHYMWPKQTDRNWSWNPNLKHQESVTLAAASLTKYCQNPI